VSKDKEIELVKEFCYENNISINELLVKFLQSMIDQKSIFEAEKHEQAEYALTVAKNRSDFYRNKADTLQVELNEISSTASTVKEISDQDIEKEADILALCFQVDGNVKHKLVRIAKWVREQLRPTSPTSTKPTPQR